MPRLLDRSIATALALIMSVPQAGATEYMFRHVPSKGQNGFASGAPPQAGTNTEPFGDLRLVAPAEVRARPGLPFAMMLDATNAVGGATFRLSSGALPAGIGLAPSGLVSGTPSVTGRFGGLVASARDGAGKEGSTRSFVLDVAPLPVVTVAAAQAIQAGQAVQIQASADHVYGSFRWRLAAGTLPAGVGLDANTGLLSGRTEQKGSFPGIVLAVTDADGAEGVSPPITITVDSTLSIGGMRPAYTARSGKPMPFLRPYVSGAGADVRWSFAEASAPRPSWLALDPSAGSLSGIPDAPGAFPDLIVRAIDIESGNAVASPSFGITIAGPPVVTMEDAYFRRSGWNAFNTRPIEIAPATRNLLGGGRWFSSGDLPAEFRVDPDSGRVYANPGYLKTSVSDVRLRVIDLFDGATTLSNPFSLTIEPALRLGGAADSRLEIGWPAHIPAPASYNVVGTAEWSLAGTLPEGLLFDPATGIIEGTPSKLAAASSYVLTLTDSRDDSKVSTSGSIGVVPEVALAVLPIEETRPARAENLVQIIPQIQGRRGTVTWSAKATLPAWASVNPVRGTLSATPPNAGNHGPFVLVAHDATLDKTVESNPFTIEATPARDISIQVAGVPGAEQGRPYLYAPTLRDAYGTTRVTLAGARLPPGLILDEATGRIAGTPTVAGNFPGIALKAADTLSTGRSAGFEIPVAPATAPGGATYAASMPSALGGTPQVPFSEIPTATGFEGTLRWTSVGTALPGWLALNAATGGLSGIPPTVGSWEGLALQVTDASGYGAVTAPFSITVTEARDPFASIDPSLLADLGVPFERTPVTRNLGGGQTWTGTGSFPPGLSIDPVTGRIRGTPTQVGSFTGLRLTVTDLGGGRASTDTFAISVSQGGLRPAPERTAYAVPLGTPLATGAPRPVGAIGTVTWTAGAGTLPGWARVDPTTGVVSGTPTLPGDLGKTADLTLTAATASQAADTAPAFSIEVTRPTLAVAPALASIPARVGSPLDLAPHVSGAVGALSFSIVGTLPPGLSVGPTDGRLRGTPAAVGTATGLRLKVVDAYDARVATSEPFSINVVLKPDNLDLSGPGLQAGLVGETLTTAVPLAPNALGKVTWSAVTPLPAWLQLAPGGASLVGVPPAVGDVTGIVLEAVDDDGVKGRTQPFDVRIGPNVKVTGVAAGYAGRARQPFSTPVPRVSNATAPYAFALRTGTLPEGLTLNEATGVISGTAPYAASATNLSLLVTDARGDTGQSGAFGIEVAGLAVSGIGAEYAATAGTAFETQAPVATGASGAVSWSLLDDGVPLPAWARLDPATGKITGTPTRVSRTSGLRLLVTDAEGATAPSRPFTIAVDARLSLAGAMNPTYLAPVGAESAITPPDARNGFGAVTWSLTGALPPWATFSSDTGRIIGTPTAKGSFPGLSLQVSDDTGKVLPAGTFTITAIANLRIDGVPSAMPARIKVPFASAAPTVRNASGTVTWSVRASGTPVASATPAGGAPASPLPSWATLNATTGVISGTPQGGGASGPLVLVATDAAGDAAESQPFSITVSNGLDVTGVPAVTATRVGLPVAIRPVVTGTSRPVTWSLASGTLPAWADLQPDGSVTGTPDVTGTTSGLLLKVVDEAGLEGYGPAFSVTVTPALEIGPVGAEIAATVGVPFSLSPTLGNALGAVRWALEGAAPAWLTLNATTGHLQGVPTGFGGYPNLTLVARDAGNAVDRSTPFAITVAKNIVVSGLKTSYAGAGGRAFATEAPRTAYAVGKVTWSVPGGTLPSWARLDAETGVITGVPDRPGTSGDVVLVATDAEGTTGHATPFRITVSSSFSASIGAIQSARVSVAGATDAPVVTGTSSIVRWSAVTALPSWASLDATTGVISGTPTAAGTVADLLLRATDPTGAQGYAGPFAIVVAERMTVDAIANQSIRSGAPLNLQGRAHNAIGAVTWTVENLPTWARFTSDGALSGRPPAPGSFPAIRIVAKDARGLAVPGNAFTVTVGPGPAITGLAASYDGRTGYPFGTIAPAAANGVGTLAWSGEGLPAGLSISAATGAITGTPTVSGTFSTTLTLADGADGARTSATTSLVVARGLGITGVAPRLVARVGASYVSPLPGILGQRGSPTWSVLGTLPPWASVDAATGAITGKPAAISSTPGLKYQLEDGRDGVRVSGDAFQLDALDPVGIAGLPTSLLARFDFPFQSARPSLLNGVEPIRWTWSPATPPPAWLKIDPDTGVISGTANSAEAVPPVRVVATDATGASAQSVQILVNVYAKPEVTVTPQAIQNRVGDVVTIAPQSKGIVGAPAWSLVPLAGASLPAGLAIDPATGAVSATLTGTGKADFVIRLTDSADGNHADSQVFSIQTRPKLELLGLAAAYRTRVNSFLATDQPVIKGVQGSLTYTISTTPSSMTFNAPDTPGMLVGAPKATASYPTVTLTIRDGFDNRTATAAFSLDILGPMTAGGVAAFTVRSGSDIAARAFTPTTTNALDPAGVRWRLGAGTLPDGVTIDPATGKPVGTVGPYTANSTPFPGLTLKATDKDLSEVSTGTFAVTVYPALALTVADQSLKEGQAFSYTVVKSGSISAGTWSLANKPAWLTIDAAGKMTGTVGAPGATSPDTVDVTYKDTLDGASVTARMTIAVAAAPVLSVTPTGTVTVANQYLPAIAGACTTLTVRNGGSVPAATIDAAVTTGGSDFATCAPATTQAVPACSGSLAPGASCAVGVGLASRTAGDNKTAKLTLTPAGGTPLVVNLTGSVKAAFASHTFTNCGQTGPSGPSLAQCQAAYTTAAWASDTGQFTVPTPGFQTFTVPLTGTYRITARGASSFAAAARAETTVALTAGQKLTIIVGQSGTRAAGSNGAGGDGGSFVFRGTTATPSTILVAGGGGGGGVYTSRNGPLAGASASLTTSGNAGGNGVSAVCSEGYGGGGGDGGRGGCAGGGAGAFGGGWSGGASSPVPSGGYAFASGFGGGDSGSGGVGGFGGGGAGVAVFGYGGGGGGFSGGGGGGLQYVGASTAAFPGGGGGSYGTTVVQDATGGMGAVVVTYVSP